MRRATSSFCVNSITPIGSAKTVSAPEPWFTLQLDVNMSSVLRMLSLLGFLALAAYGLAESEAPAPEDPSLLLEQNRRLLERWRKDPEHFNRLKNDLRAFQALPSEKQARLRQLDRDLHDEEPG